MRVPGSTAATNVAVVLVFYTDLDTVERIEWPAHSGW